MLNSFSINFYCFAVMMYRNTIMFWVNFTFANFASADAIAGKRSQ